MSESVSQEGSTGVIMTELTDSMVEQLEREKTQKSPQSEALSERIDGQANEKQLLSADG